ncbi:MAG: serine O-acetyltransferase [Candidatus Omnitrophota bacterium]
MIFAVVVIVLCWIVLLLIVFKKEIEAVFEKDPAAKNHFEVILLYSGLHAIVLYRVAHFLFEAKVPFIPRFLSQVGRFLTGIEIHPAAQIGEGFFIDHGMGVVVGETTIIGNNVIVFQGVTLGGTGKEKGKRHPTIGSDVVIGAGAKVLGNIEIGDNSYIGANAVVVKDVPQNSTVVGVPGRITKQDGQKIETTLDHVHVLDPIKQALEDLEKRLSKVEHKDH